MNDLHVFALDGVGEILAGDDLVGIFLDALDTGSHELEYHDVVIVTSKVVSKSEGRVVVFDGTDEHRERLILQESARILRRRGPLRITETPHGFVNANAGIDHSNTPAGTAVLLPKDPDRSARRFRAEIARRRGIDIGAIVTDTFGRTWRNGVTDVALGCAGLRPILDLRGTEDALGRTLEVTEVAIVDEIAAAANLVLAKDAGTPFAIVRGLSERYFGEGSVTGDVVRAPNGDLFR
ncbi:MAG: coenzyme F420-0:L-glutamate ligase [Acidimicrobiaceae bacterium]|nr:coenzyme F420-0:L-glutamate ligase [Acidimicrobiaceae bacterium]